MRRLAAFVLALAFVSTVAFAGDGGCPAGGGAKGGGCPAGGDSKGGCPMGGDAKGGGGCPNPCPLAQDAATHRSNGEEAVFASKTLRAEYVKGISKAIASL
jgi:hypothetical protein